MKNKNKLFLLIFFILVILIFLIVALNFKEVGRIMEEYLRVYGYPAVFLLVFLTEMVNQPFGPEIPASFGVIFGLNFLLVFILTLIASFLAGIINFKIGRDLLSKRILMSCDTDKYRNYCRFFYKYGKLGIFLAAVSPLPYVFFVWLTGAFNIKFKQFFIFGMLPRIIRILIIMIVISFI
jgi:membrane protein YqaA with SNARE-associated domain